MQRSRSTASELSASGDDGFFIPDLCSAQAVLLSVLLAELIVLLHVLALGPLANFDWRALATGSVFVQWIALLCLALICRSRRSLQALTPGQATGVCLGLVLLVTAVASLLLYQLFPLLWPYAGSMWDGVIRNVILALILAAIVLRYSYLQQRVAAQQRSELQLRLDALRARIRPHFLFNTLNSIASLIAVQPERAEQAIEDVAELFRAALQRDSRNTTLGDEIHLCRLYLDIEQLRLGERLEVVWHTDQTLTAQAIPALLLQPLVENAVYHGIAQRPDGGRISVSISAESSTLVLEVENPLPDSALPEAPRGHRMALENIRQRLQAQYGGEASLEVGEIPAAEASPGERSYRATIRLPIDEHDSGDVA